MDKEKIATAEREKIAHIPMIEWCLPGADAGYDHKWYYIKTEKDVDDICRYYHALDESNELDIPINDFPVWICIEENEYGFDAWYKDTLGEHLDSTRLLERTLKFSAVCPSCGNAEHFPGALDCSKCGGAVQWPKAKLTEVALRAIQDNADECEKLVTALLNSIDTDVERPDRTGRQLIEAYLAGDIEGLLMAICGWSMESLLEFAKKPE